MHVKNQSKANYCNIPLWWDKGYTGKGVKIAVLETPGGHGGSVADIVRQVAPEAEMLHRPQPSRKLVSNRLTPDSYKQLKAHYESLVAEGVNIVAMSLAGSDSPDIEQLIRDILISNGITLFTSAGNSDERGLSEAATTSAWISVGACDMVKGKPKKTGYSSVGKELDVCGFSNIYSSTGGYLTGTSFSNPWVTGMAALWFQRFKKQYNRYPTWDETYEFVTTNTEDLETEGHDLNTGYGLFVLPKELLETEEKKPMAMVIEIDPGHGGNDPGAVGALRTQEKDVTLMISKRVAEILRAAGADARLTRDNDKHFSTNLSTDLSARAKIANQVGAAVFVSIHCNSSTNWSATGTESYHYPGSTEGKKLAECLQKALVPTLGTKDRKVKEENFAVLRETNMPAALVELAFISNPQEEELLRDPVFQEKAAQAIAKGIGDYLGIDVALPKATMFSDVPPEHWAVESIERRAKDGIMAGYRDGTFKPEEVVTRAQLAVVVDRVLKMLGR